MFTFFSLYIFPFCFHGNDRVWQSIERNKAFCQNYNFCPRLNKIIIFIYTTDYSVYKERVHRQLEQQKTSSGAPLCSGNLHISNITTISFKNTNKDALSCVPYLSPLLLFVLCPLILVILCHCYC